MNVILLSLIMLMQLLLQITANNIILSLNSKEDVCRFFPNETIIRKPGSCTETLICIEGVSKPNGICPEGLMVSLSDMKCVNKVSDNYCINKVKCSVNGPKWIEDSKNCHEWHACDKNVVVKSGTCSPDGIFSQDKQACIHGNLNCDKTYEICNIALENKPFWDEFNCHKYYKCTKSGLKIERCDEKHYYDKLSGNCTAKAMVDCYKHPIPDGVCGNKKLAIRDRFVKDQATCRGYFYCKFNDVITTSPLNWNYDPDQDPHWGQCPMGLFFDEDQQACKDQNYVKCEEDRCDSRESGKILSEKPGCQSFLICKNGYTENVGTCENGKYFDPSTEECVDKKISYPICA